MLPDESIIAANDLKVKNSLGEGAFAFVNLAEYKGRLVAIKTLKPELLENPADVKLFLKETELMRKIRHPAIVDLIGVGGKIDNGGSENFLDLFIVQEFCGGGSLRDLVYKQMTTNRKFLYSQADALRWCVNIAKALHYLHSANPKVIHRDLKLDNVLLTDSNVSVTHAKLADFGLAKLLASSQKGQQRQLNMKNLASKSEQDLLPLERTRTITVKKLMTSLDSMRWKDTFPETQNKDKNNSAETPTTAQPQSSNTGNGTTNNTNNNSDGSTMSPFASESIKTPQPPLEKNHSGNSAISISRASSGSGMTGHDMTGEAGSYSYMAPEVLRGEKYDEKADIFSFAMLMYNLFYRVIPSVLLFANGGQSEDMSMLAWETANGYRPKLSTTGTIPDSVHEVINQCWSGVPELRPSAEELIQKLVKIQESGVCKGSDPSKDGGSRRSGGDSKSGAGTGCACSIM
jgi:serine/threonine protein kinase